jgi:hypothetical protein
MDDIHGQHRARSNLSSNDKRIIASHGIERSGGEREECFPRGAMRASDVCVAVARIAGRILRAQGPQNIERPTPGEIRAPGMGTEQEVRVLWDPDGGNPNRRDKGAGKVDGAGGPARGCLVEV